MRGVSRHDRQIVTPRSRCNETIRHRQRAGLSRKFRFLPSPHGCDRRVEIQNASFHRFHQPIQPLLQRSFFRAIGQRRYPRLDFRDDERTRVTLRCVLLQPRDDARVWVFARPLGQHVCVNQPTHLGGDTFDADAAALRKATGIAYTHQTNCRAPSPSEA